MDLAAIGIGVIAVVVALVIVAGVVAVPFVMIAVVVDAARAPRRPPAVPIPAAARFVPFTDDDEIEARHHSR